MYPDIKARSSYSKGCRCSRCKTAWNAYQREAYIHIFSPFEQQCRICADRFILRHWARNMGLPRCDRCDAYYARKIYQCRRHQRTWCEIDSLLQGREICWVCTEPVSFPDADIDHDHLCCEGHFACRNCFRGYAHHKCNIQLGAVESFIARIGEDRFMEMANQLKGTS